jgi:hypothetical protein
MEAAVIDFLKIVFPIARDPGPQPKPEMLKDYELGHPIPGTRCMRLPCEEERWFHPDLGEIVLCREHGREVAEGVCRAPSLRTRVDYYGSSRRAFILDVPVEDGGGAERPLDT